MKTPQTWTQPEPWTGYTVIIFPAKGNGRELPNAYKTQPNAARAASRELTRDPSAASAVIRFEKIIKRTDTAEFSSSSPIEIITR